jgi:hypothetical protein
MGQMPSVSVIIKNPWMVIYTIEIKEIGASKYTKNSN